MFSFWNGVLERAFYTSSSLFFRGAAPAVHWALCVTSVFSIFINLCWRIPRVRAFDEQVTRACRGRACRKSYVLPHHAVHDHACISSRRLLLARLLPQPETARHKVGSPQPATPAPCQPPPSLSYLISHNVPQRRAVGSSTRCARHSASSAADCERCEFDRCPNVITEPHCNRTV